MKVRTEMNMNQPNPVTGVDFFFSGTDVEVEIVCCLFNDYPEFFSHYSRPMKFETSLLDDHPINGSVWSVTAMWDDDPLHLSPHDVMFFLSENRALAEIAVRQFKNQMPQSKLEYVGSEFYCRNPLEAFQ